MGYALPGTPLDINQKAKVLWQSKPMFRIVNALTLCARQIYIIIDPNAGGSVRDGHIYRS